jgi:hypothetical protein
VLIPVIGSVVDYTHLHPHPEDLEEVLNRTGKSKKEGRAFLLYENPAARLYAC